jgi:autotransporter-associated beta strand protein
MKPRYLNPTLRRVLLSCGLGLVTASSATAGGIISYNFSENAGNQGLDTTTPKGPLGTSIWNDSNAEGAGASGSESNLVDQTGTDTGAAISWSSANTWWNGSGTGTEDTRVLVGYLDDGGNGVNVTLTNIPYAKYNVYGIVASDAGGEYQSQNFQINNRWAFEEERPMLLNTGSLGSVAKTTVMNGTIVTGGAIAGLDDPSFTTTAGSAQIVKVPYNAALNPGGPFTVEAWLKPDTTLSGTTLTCALSSMEVTGNRTGWLIYQSATGWNFRTYNAAGSATAANLTGGPVPTAGVWNHVVASWDGSVAKLYVDGVLVATSAATTYAPCTTRDMHFGSRSDGAFAWGGQIDEVAFYGSALSDSAVASHQANGLDANRTTPYSAVVQADAPLGYWTGSNELAKVKSATGGLAYGEWAAAGSQWVRMSATQRGNYFKVSGITGSSCVIQGENASAPGRGSLTAVMIEEVVVPNQLVRPGKESFSEANLAADQSSEFRIGQDLVTVTDAGAFSTNATHTVNVLPMPGVAAGTYKLIDYSGSIGGAGFAGLALAPLGNPRYTLSLVDNTTDGSVDVNYAPAEEIVWTGGTGTWDIDGATNWKTATGTEALKFLPYDSARFDDTATAGNVTIAATVSPLAVTVDNDALAYTIAGEPIAGASGLIKSGPGELTLTGANTFTGSIAITGGVVHISSAGNLGAGGSAAFSLENGAVLHSTASLQLNRKFNVVGSADVKVDEGFEVGVPGGFKGSGTLYKTGKGDLRFGNYGGGAFSGSMVVEEGRLIMSGGAFNSNLGLGSITVKGGASLVQPAGAYHALGGAWAPTPAISLEPGATFVVDQENYISRVTLSGATLSGASELRTDYGFLIETTEAEQSSVCSLTIAGVIEPIRFAVADGTPAVDLVMSGGIRSGENPPKPFIKSGAGTMEMTADQPTYAGTVTVEAGTLKFSGIGGFSGSKSLQVASGANLNVADTSAVFTLGFDQTLSGSGKVTGAFDVRGTLAPGDAAGTAGVIDVDGTLGLLGDAILQVDVTSWDANQVAGTTHDAIQADAIEVVADGAVPAKVVISTPADLQFTEAERVLVLADSAATSDLAADAIIIDAADFFVDTGAKGTWAARKVGNQIQLVYTPGVLTPFESWAAQITDAGKRGPQDDPDGDGLNNETEFLFGGSPVDAGGSLVSSTRGATSLTLSWLQRNDTGSFALQETTGLGNWGTSAVTPAAATDQAGVPAGYTRMTAVVPVDSAKKFVRVQGTTGN